MIFYISSSSMYVILTLSGLLVANSFGYNYDVFNWIFIGSLLWLIFFSVLPYLTLNRYGKYCMYNWAYQSVELHMNNQAKGDSIAYLEGIRDKMVSICSLPKNIIVVAHSRNELMLYDTIPNVRKIKLTSVTKFTHLFGVSTYDKDNQNKPLRLLIPWHFIKRVKQIYYLCKTYWNCVYGYKIESSEEVIIFLNTLEDFESMVNEAKIKYPNKKDKLEPNS